MRPTDLVTLDGKVYSIAQIKTLVPEIKDEYTFTVEPVGYKNGFDVVVKKNGEHVCVLARIDESGEIMIYSSAFKTSDNPDRYGWNKMILGRMAQ